MSDRYRRIYAVVERIPHGRVATYGQIAALAGFPGHARQVGYALHALEEESSLPWHRVVSHTGRVSPRSSPGWEHLQRILLQEEGVLFDARGRLDLQRHRWGPSDRELHDVADFPA